MAINVGDLVANLRLDMGGFAAGIERAQTKMNDLGSTMKSRGKAMTSAGKSMTAGVTAPLVGLGAAAFKTSADFEGSMNRVKAVLGDAATETGMVDLTDQAKELGASTVFSAKEAADGMAFLSQAGFKTDEILGAMGGTLDLAAAGQLDLARAADISSNVLSGFGLAASDSDRAADVLAKTASSANTSVEQMGEAMSFVAPVAASAGLEMEQVGAAVGILGNAGIQGSRAGTTLSNAITKLLKPSSKAEKVMKSLGLNVQDAEGNMRPFDDIVQQLADSGATTAQMMEIFGLRAGPGMAALVGQGADSISSLNTTLDGAEGSAGQMADTMMEGAAGAMARMKAAAEAVMIAIGDSGLLSSITSIIEKVGGFLTKISETNPRLLKMGLIVAAVAAAIGPLLIVAGLVVQALGALATVAGVVSAPMLLIPLAIAAVVAALVWLWNTNEGFRNAVIAAWTRIKAFIQTALAVVTEVIRAFVEWAKEWWATWGEDIIATAQKAWEMIQSTIQSALDFISAFIEVTLDMLQALWRTWGGTLIAVGRRLFDVLQNVIENVWNGIKNIISGVLNVIQGIFETFAGLLTGDWSRMWEGIKQIAVGLWQTLVGLWQGIVNSVVDILHGLVAAAGRMAGDLVARLTGPLITFAGDVIGYVGDIVGNIKDGFFDLIDDMVGIGGDIIQGLIDGITGAVGGAVDAVTDAVSSVKDGALSLLGISSPSKVFMDIGQETSRGLAMGIEAQASQAVRSAEDMARRAADAGSGMSMTANVTSRRDDGSISSGFSRRGDGPRKADIIVELDGRQIMRAIGKPLVDEIRLRGGVRTV